MANTTNFSVRMDSNIKKQCARLYNEPREVQLDQPNKETIAAMLEAERIGHNPCVKHYSDVEEALRELKR